MLFNVIGKNKCSDYICIKNKFCIRLHISFVYKLCNNIPLYLHFYIYAICYNFYLFFYLVSKSGFQFSINLSLYFFLLFIYSIESCCLIFISLFQINGVVMYIIAQGRVIFISLILFKLML